ncbi:Hypp1494 [Branchiostoma lanceolatum]|uniref:Hypp1494 protein n=1 Tax=Branchiostoma lanceolatum TaxID=7740 RepID=A0A8J9ZJS2_BRALA|nr:Hypp1494 [Branchiostoma lanceolatum]
MRRHLSSPLFAGLYNRRPERERLVPTRPDDAPPAYSEVVPSAPPLQYQNNAQGGVPPYAGTPPPPPAGYNSGTSAYPRGAGNQYAQCPARNPKVIVLRDDDHGDRPMATYCHICHRNVVTHVSYREGGANEGLLCLTSLLGCIFWPICLLLPFCLLCDRESTAVHYCPMCHSKIAEYEL